MPGFRAMALWPFIFVRSDEKFPKSTEVHEKIHFKQQKELLLVFFLILYLILFVIYGYKENPFEREANANEHNEDYLNTRKWYSWFKYF